MAYLLLSCCPVPFGNLERPKLYFWTAHTKYGQSQEAFIKALLFLDVDFCLYTLYNNINNLNMQVCEYACVHVFSYMQVCKYAHICKYASMNIYASMMHVYESMQVCTYMQLCNYAIMQ